MRVGVTGSQSNVTLAKDVLQTGSCVAAPVPAPETPEDSAFFARTEKSGVLWEPFSTPAKEGVEKGGDPAQACLRTKPNQLAGGYCSLVSSTTATTSAAKLSGAKRCGPNPDGTRGAAQNTAALLSAAS
jgi:hypothetical protein